MIIIIGAGLSGLTLARYLQSRNVPFRIFDQSDAQRPQGYGLTMRKRAIEGLLPILGICEESFRTAVAVDRKDGAIDSQIIDMVTGEMANVSPYSSEAIKDFRCNRKRLRLMIQGSLKIEFNHKLTSIREENDAVVASFANGAEVSGDLLVAADGVHSFVRRTFVSHAKPQDFEGLMYNGIRKMSTRDFEQTLRPALGKWCVRIGCHESRVIAVTVFDFDQENEVVSISWGYSRRLNSLNDPLFVPYSREHNISDVPHELWEEIENLQHPLIEPFRTIFGDPDIRKDEIIHHRLVTLLIPREDLSITLRKHKIAFIGDAAHAWSNFAGTGGNNAVLDGLELGKVLQEGKSPEIYYDKRYPQWKNSIVSNEKTYNDMHKRKPSGVGL